MADKSSHGRRSFLKAAGAVGVTGTTLLAGCGGSPNNASQSSSKQSSSRSSSSGGASTSSSKSLTKITLSGPPVPWVAAIQNHIKSTGTLDDMLASAGYKASYKQTYSGPSLFASGKVDLCSMGGTEAGFLAAQRGWTSRSAGRSTSRTV